MSIPILWNHDHTAAIGRCDVLDDGRLRIMFTDGAKVTKEMLWGAFGGAGFTINKYHETDGIVYLDEIIIHEISMGLS